MVYSRTRTGSGNADNIRERRERRSAGCALIYSMSAIKDGRMPVELNGKTYYLLFSLNALDEMQDRFGGI